MSKPCSIFNSIEDLYNFGQYEGLSLADVLDINPSYVEWCVYQCDGRHFIISDEVIEQIKTVYPDFKISSDFEYACEQRQADFDDEIYDEVEIGARDYIYIVIKTPLGGMQVPMLKMKWDIPTMI